MKWGLFISLIWLDESSMLSDIVNGILKSSILKANSIFLSTSLYIHF